jgi:acetyltransferase
MPLDAPYLVDLFENMGSDSRYNRFLQPVDHIEMERVWQVAEIFAESTGGASYGVVAFADMPAHEGAPVAAARYMMISTAQAEIGVSVRDDMHNMGIGTALMNLLVNHAAGNGVVQLIGTVQNSNGAMLKMLANLGYRIERQSEGSYSQITIHVHETVNREHDFQDAATDYSPEPQMT